MLDSALIWARVPKLFLAVAALYGMIDRKSSPLPPALRSLVTVRVSQINGCAFCVDLNTATLLKRGVSMEKAQAIQRWRESSAFDDLERIALEYAEAMTFPERRVDDELVARLRSCLNEDAIVELTGLIAFQNLSSKFNSALGVPAQGFCAMPTASGHGDLATHGAPGPAADVQRGSTPGLSSTSRPSPSSK